MKRFYFLTAILLSFWQLSAQTYCTPAFASGCAGGDMIDDFTVASAGFSHTATGCSANAYEDFSATQTLTVQPALVYNFLVKHGYSGQYVAIWADFNNDGTFDPTTELIGSGQSANVGGTNQTSSTFTVPSTVSLGNYRMRVAVRWLSAPIPCNTDGYGEAHDYTLAVTAPPTCLIPSAFTSSNILTTSADLSWSAPSAAPANGYTIYYSTVNAAPTTATVLDATNSVTTSNLTATLSGLSPMTTYYVWIRSNCSASDQSIWIGLPSLLTACAPVTTMFENFDSYPTGSIVPQCWARIVDGSSPGSQTISSTTPASGSRNLYQYSDSSSIPVIVVLPEFSNINAGTHWLRFKARVSTAPGDLEVGYVTDPADAATFVVLSTIAINNTTYSSGADYTVNVPTTVPAGARLAVRNAADGNSYYWDDVYWEVIPTCFMPSGVTLSTITSTSAALSWTAPSTAPANGYTVYYSTTNTAPTATTVLDATNSVTSTTTAAALSGLTPNTPYFVWVRSNCSGTDVSTWTSAGSFTTLCATFTPNYSNDFSTFPGACWSQASGGAPSTGTGTGTTNYWAADGFLNSGSTGAAKFNIYSTDRTGWLISPVFNLSAGGYRVKFDYGATVYAGTGPTSLGSDDLVQFVISTDGGVTWTVLQTWDATNAPSNTTNTYTYNLTTYTGNNTRFALYATSGTTNDTEDLDFFADNFAVETIPTCDSATNILVDAATVTATGGSVTFTPSVSTPAGGYQVYFSNVNTAPTGATVLTPANSVSTATSPATLTGLSAATTYYVWVRSVCSATDMSVWTGGIQFTTACATITPAYTNDFGTFPGICWEQASGGSAATGPTGTSTSWYNDGFLNSGSSGAAGINLYADFTTGWLITPTFDLSAGPYTLTFDYGLVEWASTTSGALGSDDQVQVLMSTNGGSTWTVLHTWDASTAISNTSTPYAYVVNGGTNQTKFAIYATEGSTNDAEDVEFFVDNFGLVAGALGVGEIAADTKEVKVYPNPFTDVVNITDAKDLKSVAVVDMSGRLVKTIANPGRQINLGELKAGLYILKLDYKDGSVKTVKAIKK